MLLFTGAGDARAAGKCDDDGPAEDANGGIVQVALGPAEAVRAGARWWLDSAAAAHASGEHVTDVAASFSRHGTTMTDCNVLPRSWRVRPGNAAGRSYVTKSSMKDHFGAKLKLVVDWTNQGANP